MKKELSFVYIAVDGKKFINEKDAIDYERQNLKSKSIVKRKYSKINSYIK